MSIRVLIIDDHAVVRKGIRALIETEPDLEAAGEAGDGETAVIEAERSAPDVVLMDLIMPKVDGIEAARRILAGRPRTKILALTSAAADDKIYAALRAGVQGYLLKDASVEELVEAIRRVDKGEFYLHPAIARRVVGLSSAPPLDQLTDREREVLRLVALGRSNRAIGEELHISEATVRTHVSNILSKLHLTSRTQAALYALRDGLISLEETGAFPEKK